MATTRATTRAGTRRNTSRSKTTARRRNTARKSPATSALSPELRVEIYGLVIVAFAVLLLLALISFQPAGDWQPVGAATNWVGPVGARLGGLILSVVGLLAFPLDVALLAYGITVVLGTPIRVPSRYLVGGSGLTLSVMVLVQLVADGARVLGHHPAGWVGAYLTEGCRALLSTAGTSIVASTALFISVIWLTGISASSAVAPLFASLFSPVLRGLAALRDTLLDMWDDIRWGREDAEGDAGANAVGAPKAGRAPRRSKSGVRQPLDAPDEGADEGAGEAADSDEAERSPTVVSEGAAAEGGDAAGPRVVEPAWLEHERERTMANGRPRTTTSAKAEPDAIVLSPDEAAGLANDGLSIEDLDDDEFQAIEAELDGAASTLPAAGAARPRAGSPPRREPGGPKIVESEAMRVNAQLRLGLPDTPKTVLTPSKREWALPSLDFLDYEPPNRETISADQLKDNAAVLEQKLLDFGVKGKVVEIHPGPVITMYEFKPAAGVKISKIANLADDLSMALAAMRVRIVAPIPGKSVVGIEVPNKAREIVYLKEVMANETFQKPKSVLTLALGKDIVGYPTSTDLAKAPHLLVAGSTGSGKSVALNTFIVSILYKATPDDVRLIMVDPKMLELSVYEGIPHLLLPVVTDPKKAAQALRWAVSEMERRYKLLAERGVRNISGYNTQIDEVRAEYEQRLQGASAQRIVLGEDGEEVEERHVDPPPERLPFIVVIIDELADLMMVASKEVETSIARLAQMARAAGIHLILATQRPSVDVITGLIKANFPTRVSFQVSSKIDSRTILDRQGAENLLGMGDMLFMPPGTSKLTRIHGAYIAEKEIARITSVLKKQGKPDYCMEILADEEEGAGAPKEEREYDEYYDQSVAIVAETRNASISYLQRRLKIGYNRAARIVEMMEHEGIVGPQNGPGPREVFIDPI